MNTKHIQLPIEGEQLPPKTPITRTHLKGLHKLAQAILPASQNHTAFEKTEPEKHINGMLDYMYPDDRSAILTILWLFAFLPVFKIRFLVILIEKCAKWPGMWGALFRMLQIALKGLIFTLYYSDFTPEKSIHQKLNWETKMADH